MYGSPASCASCRARSPSLNTTRAHPNALRERLALAWRRVKTVIVPELHEFSIFGFMADSRDIHTGKHCFFVLYAHLVFVTKYPHQVFAVKHLERMEEIMQAVCADFGSATPRVQRRGQITSTCW